MNQTLQKIRKEQNQKALDAYVSEIGKAASLLESLSTYVNDHGDISPDDVDFSDVGTMVCVVELLREIYQFVGLS